jgi:hypothetical protein
MSRDAYDMFKSPDRGRFGENEEQHRPGRGPRVTGASDLVDLTLTVRADRPKSVAVTDDTKVGAKWVWLPKSQIEIVGLAAGNTVQITMPEWLAKDKGLL